MTSVTPISEQRARRSDFPFTDLGNSRRFVAENRDDVRFVPGIGWLTWDGKRWAPDVDGAIRRLAKETMNRMYAEAVQDMADAGSIADTNERRSEVDLAKGRLNHALKSQAEAKLRAMVSLAETELEVIAKAADLDRPPLLFCTPSGTVNLTDGMLHPHRREDLITRVTSAAYDPDAIAPRWTRFLRGIMAGDETRVAYLQRMIGYSVTGLTREQKIFLLLGDGANGKTVLGKTLVKLLGDYGVEVDFETFLVRDRGSTRSDLVRLRGKRFGLASEMLPGERLDTRRLKEWVGGEDVVARELYRSEVSFQPITKLWFLANCVPVVQDSSFGIWRRLVRLPFEVTIPEEKRDPDLVEKLMAEGPGIMKWIVDGCRAYLAEGLGEDPVAAAATAAWRSESDQNRALDWRRCGVGRWREGRSSDRQGQLRRLVRGRRRARHGHQGVRRRAAPARCRRRRDGPAGGQAGPGLGGYSPARFRRP